MPTVVQFTPGDPFWASNTFNAIPSAETGCGSSVAAYPGITPIAGWSVTDVSVAYRDFGAGRVWFTDFDWQDTGGSPAAAFADTATFMGYMIDPISALWQPVDCTTPEWVWTADRVNANSVPLASSAGLLFVGDQHTTVLDTCSLDGTGYVSTQTVTMAGCNVSWGHLGGNFNGNCGGHDGDITRRLVMDCRRLGLHCVWKRSAGDWREL